MHTVTWPDGARAPALALGTWRLGEQTSRRAAEVAALRDAFELGYRLVDTAEMYGDGGAETVVGDALAQALRAGTLARDDVTIVSKACPQHAGARSLPAACESSLKRLRVDHLDLYLLHWRGSVPLAETVAAMQRLRERGRVRRWGVSNFDVADMDELLAAGGHACATNQVWYSLGQRGVEFDLLPWQRHRGMPLMAYCPIDQGALARHAKLAPLAERRRATPAQLALAWVLKQPGVIAIPKAGSTEHLRLNLDAARLALGADDLAALDRLFPPPRSKRPLAMT
ncbi:aldo/keto reductase [Azohydromonas sp.]|uniref:aldo/keto reductase n=1 Tax=Azohydromonas sp. TaxID=1872666 RepID=UPI002B9C70DC|nr:aldo/keto reductase [Azohydromonas sp.]HMM84794.1 aldo/keto reductase [Azohydromonas sp.]